MADSYNNKIKVCDPKTRTVKTFAGDGRRGSTDSPPEFSEPGGLSLAGADLYVADTNNHRIRVIDTRTQAVRTLDLEGVRPPSQARTPKFPRATVINVPPGRGDARPRSHSRRRPRPARRLQGQRRGPARLPRRVRHARHLRPRGLLDRPAGRVPVSKEFTLNLPLAKQAPTGSKLNLKLSVSAFVCLPNSLCTVKNYVWNVPITFEVGRPGPIRLTTAP